MSSKRQTTNYNRYSKILSGVRDIFSQARYYRLESSKINEKLSNYKAEHGFSKLPAYYQGLLSGWIHCEFEMLWKEMEFCYQVDGIWYSTSKDTKKPNLRTLENQNMKGNLHAFFWKDTEKNYTPIIVCE